MTSVVIAAHNEAAVIDRCLAAVLEPGGETGLQVIVVANGCHDDTAAIARRRGVTVIERAEPGKAGALNAGDAVATSFPRIYLDADVVLSPGAVAALASAVGTSGALAAIPRRRMELVGRSWLVRAYYAIHSRLPAVVYGLYGRGAIAVSAPGRGRFVEFPDQMADDLFLDSLFAEHEKALVDSAQVSVAAPMRVGDLVRRLARVRAGNTAMRATGTGIRPARRMSWLTDVVLRAPWLAPAGVCYVAITVMAARRAGRLARAGQVAWAHDRSSRVTA
ncbi:MAG TPA: glycosyltransferase [Micromonosporaceae bacterium]